MIELFIEIVKKHMFARPTCAKALVSFMLPILLYVARVLH